jgi:hypothetical protein
MRVHAPFSSSQAYLYKTKHRACERRQQVMEDKRVVVGVFVDPAQAEQAFHDLQLAGFREDHIGFIVRDATALPQGVTAEHPSTETETGPAVGAVAGGVLGGVTGAAAALLIPGLGPAIAGGILATIAGATLGAATGSLIAMLTHWGVPEEEAHTYDQAFQAGRTIVIVQADERPWEAFAILKRHCADGSDTSPAMAKAQDPEATVRLETLESE